MKAEVEKTVRELNRCWVEGRYGDLGPFFDPQVVLLPPGNAAAITGRQAVVESYRQFGAVGTLNSFRVGRVEVHPFGRVAMAHMSFDVDYEVKGQRRRESGLEIYTLVQDGGRWRIIWRTQMTFEAS